MPNPELDHQVLWKAQEAEPTRMTTEEVCARARDFEKKDVHEYRFGLALLGFICAVFAFYLYRFSDPLIRIGSGSVVATFLYILARATHHRPAKRLVAASAGDTCADYLRTGLRKKKEGVLEIRLTILLIFPAVVAFWWGGGPVAVAKWVGIDTPWLTRYQESPAPLVVFALMLAANWILGGMQARDIEREIKKLGAD